MVFKRVRFIYFKLIDKINFIRIKSDNILAKPGQGSRETMLELFRAVRSRTWLSTNPGTGVFLTFLARFCLLFSYSSAATRLNILQAKFKPFKAKISAFYLKDA